METKIEDAIYETALARIEELLALVNDNTSSTDHRAIELKIMTAGRKLSLSEFENIKKLLYRAVHNLP